MTQLVLTMTNLSYVKRTPGGGMENGAVAMDNSMFVP